MASSSSSQSSLLFLSLVLLFLSSSCEQIPFKEVDLDNPVLHFWLHPILGHASQGAEDLISCERIRVSGLSRSNIRSYANAFRVMLKPSDAITERLYGKIEVCFHGNASIGLCQCEKDEWKTVPKQLWSTVMSPYQDGYLDVKLVDGLSGSITVSVEEEFQQWRLFCLGFGFVLLLLAPIISSWVPFYYSSSMALGVLLVILILLFQGMKLLPTGRKSVFYLTIYGSVLGAGSFLLHYFSMLVNSVLVNFGLSEDMYNPVSVFVLLGIILAGAALGYWVVRKFVLSEDGSVDVGIAQFVMWAMRIVAAVFIFQSSLDTLYATVVFFTCWATCSRITSMRRQRQPSMLLAHSVKINMWQRKSGYKSPNHNRAEFLRSAKMGSEKTAWGSPKSPYVWSNSPTKVMAPKKRPHVEASSSSSFDHTRFPSLAKSTLFYEQFAHRNIESEREVAAELHDKAVCRSLANRDWYPLMKFDSKKIHVDLVREFYCNLEVLENGSVKTYVRGKWITISVADIAEFINIQEEEGADYPIPDKLPAPIDYDAIATILCGVPTHWPGGIILHGNLTAEYRFLNRFVCHNLEPRGHTSNVAQKNGYLLYCIGTGRRVNSPLVYLHVIVQTLTAKRNSLLPFGVFVTEFLAYKEIQVRQNEPFVKVKNPINARTIAQSFAHVTPAQREDQGNQGYEAAQANVEGEQPGLHHRFDQLALQVQDLSARVDSGFTQVNAALAELLARMGQGLVVLSPGKGVIDQDYYSTFHKTPGRKQFSKKEWKDFTRESTRQAMAEWASSPEFTDWIIDHADRIQLMPGESSDDSIASVSDSSDENIVGETGSALSFFRLSLLDSSKPSMF